jgi:hypothetical protein
MSEQTPTDLADAGRRDILRGAGAVVLAGVTASVITLTQSAAASAMSAETRNSEPLGLRLQGVQHFGLTVQNMEREPRRPQRRQCHRGLGGRSHHCLGLRTALRGMGGLRADAPRTSGLRCDLAPDTSARPRMTSQATGPHAPG